MRGSVAHPIAPGSISQGADTISTMNDHQSPEQRAFPTALLLGGNAEGFLFRSERAWFDLLCSMWEEALDPEATTPQPL
jgi:hypothetical protein